MTNTKAKGYFSSGKLKTGQGHSGSFTLTLANG